jgi:hypothetical protein
VDSQLAHPRQLVMTCRNAIHRLCRTKTRSHFELSFSTGKFTGRIDMPVENMCVQAIARGFSPDSERVRPSVHRHAEADRGARSGSGRGHKEPAAPGTRVSYDSPVCSNTGDAINRIMAAIDQLASDAQEAKGGADEGELATRIATLWGMVSDLDPELARRAQGYTRQVGGEPSD